MHNDARPPDVQGKGKVNSVKQKGDEMVHNDARPYNARGGNNIDGVKRKGDETMEGGGGLGRTGDVHCAVEGRLRLEVFTEVLTAAGGTTIEKDVGEGTTEDAEFYGRGGGVEAHLSWQCQQHVGDMLATCQKVTKFGSTCMSVPTQKVPRHKNFASEITDKL